VKLRAPLPDQGWWEPFEPADIAGLLDGFAAPWWIAGGWAIDLFIGRLSRAHDDLDIELPRAALVELATLLGRWDFNLASSGNLCPWRPDDPLPDDMHGLWCRPDPESPWRFQILLAEVRGDVWHFRRDPRVTRPLADIGYRSAHGWPVIAPEIQLLYKAAGRRPKDEHDLELILPLLSGNQLEWLASSLTTWQPGHPWLERVRG
jgi:hypothetical protein